MSTLAVIIPTLNEAAHLPALLGALGDMATPALLVIVSDGGSSDDTLAIARHHGAHVVQSARGRGAQLNAGAHLALAQNAEILWFLHADALPHPRAATHILRCAAHGALGGNFRLRFRDEALSPKARAYARFFARLARQQRRVGVYYGDSGVWLTAASYRQIGPLRDWPLFEDYDLARRLEKLARRQNQPTNLAPWPIYASPRRFSQHPERTLALWLLLQIAFSLGVSPQKLAEIYRREN